MPWWLKGIWIALLVCGYPLLTYRLFGSWWVAMTGTLLIVGLARMAWPADWRQRTGLCIPRRAALAVLLAYLTCAALAFGLISRAAASRDVAFSPVWELEGFGFAIAHSAAQTLNEEMVLGALLLNAVTVWWKRPRPILVSVSVAAAFALFHLAFYGLRPEGAVNMGLLGAPALAALFGIGVLRSNLILGCRHLGYAWAIHFGWNTIFLNSAYVLGKQSLNEPQMFDLVLGHWMTVAVILTGAAMTTFALRRVLLERPGAKLQPEVWP